MPKFNVGDEVILREFGENQHPHFTHNMKGYVNRTFKIKRILYYNPSIQTTVYKLEWIPYYWREDAMELLSKYDKVKRFKEILRITMKILD